MDRYPDDARTSDGETTLTKTGIKLYGAENWQVERSVSAMLMPRPTNGLKQEQEHKLSLRLQFELFNKIKLVPLGSSVCRHLASRIHS